MMHIILMECNGWEILCVKATSPISLIKFIRSGEILYSRFDIDKRMFIDAIPTLLGDEDRRHISKTINDLPK